MAEVLLSVSVIFLVWRVIDLRRRIERLEQVVAYKGLRETEDPRDGILKVETGRSGEPVEK